MAKGLYIHIPFCSKKCPYCDFYSVTGIELINKYTKAVIRNIRHLSLDINEIDTVYFGGGTPSLLLAKDIESILSVVPLTPKCEISMECNPESVNFNYFNEVKSAGINRISIGIQSLKDSELKHLGRIHNSNTAVNAAINACKAGFDNISADLMLATPGQTSGSLNESINELIKLPVSHISAYLLKVEPDTPLSNSDILPLIPDEDITADMYLNTVEILDNAGFEQYEISNFSKPGYECRHNLKYWNCEEYYGIGPHAHSFVNDIRYSCNMDIQSFINSGYAEYTITEPNAGTFEETAMLKLRLTKTGLDISEFPEQRDMLLEKSQFLNKHGFININGTVLTLTPKGCLISNEVIYRLIY